MATASTTKPRTLQATLARLEALGAERAARALAVGEALGIYREYLVSKGCTSPFAPIWIGELVRRQG